MSRSERGVTARFVVAVVVLAVAASGAVGFGVASGQGTDSYSIQQGDQCETITPLSGNDSAKEFYAYNLPYPDNPYATGPNESYSSEGTTDLQQNRTSLLFLHRVADGNLSLVIVHGTKGEGSDGGAASFQISGLPADGAWTVKDDEYDNSHNYDRWNHTRTTAAVDWTWGGNATDGGVYEGLGDDFEVTIEPAFDEDAALFGQYYDGTVEEWQVLSDDRDEPERTSLDRSEPVTISSGPCDESATAPGGGTGDDRGAGQDVPDRDDETEAETPEVETETEDAETEDEETETEDEETEVETETEDEESEDEETETDDDSPFGDDGPFDDDGPFGEDGPFDDDGTFDGNDTFDGSGG